ncbi:1,4-dihydroxy-2-naphthoate octaprenyltransferase [Bifidobacterium oedipodis]|uniref:1,4-dihydroxy-2-naphthoate octaprenyltransferase n=1 Tax=Bifidobacterium oedipodis TaxID=2675322 RepID=A0A7Y0EPQ0_9BIFI|nr:1,4-dihydroxy-2-naphthoate octaprenyltransferase [Bifidobacterium sp. DSM 109957]NMM94178.1 1,4-dihydroxy-2-naphthoate octaprenyltransferase [Bifidobacterium sp. DSM 109957]
MRPRTLPASIAPVVLGACAAWESMSHLGMCILIYPEPESCKMNAARLHILEARFWAVAVLCALVALLMQIAVNYANDYADGVRGTDEGRSEDRSENGIGRAPTRLVASGVPANRVLAAAGISASLACLAGLAIVVMTGYWWLVLVGALCVVAGWFYTGGSHPYGYAGFGELAVFVFFGLVATLGTQFALAGEITALGWLFAVLGGLNAVLILMVNNLRDRVSDLAHGKHTVAARLGEPMANMLFVVLAIAAVVLSVVTLLLAVNIPGNGLSAVLEPAIAAFGGGSIAVKTVMFVGMLASAVSGYCLIRRVLLMRWGSALRLAGMNTLIVPLTMMLMLCVA